MVIPTNLPQPLGSQDAERLSVVLDGVADGITMQDAEGRLVYANYAAARMAGYATAEAFLKAPPAEILRHLEVMKEDGRALTADELPGRAVPATASLQERLIRFRQKDTGEERWTVVRAKAILDESGRALFVINLLHDVTEQRRQEEALRISHEWFSTVLRGIGDAVFTTDAVGVITFMNPVCEELTGWSAAEVKGRPLHEVFVILNEDTRRPVDSPVDRVIREGLIVGLANHTLLVRKDGTEICIADSAAPIRDRDGQLSGVVLVFRNVTDERKEERRRTFIAQATIELNSSLDYEATLASVARAAVPAIADWCAVDIVEEGKLQRLAVAHVDPAKIKFVEEVERRYPTDPNAPSGLHNILRTGQPEMIAEIPAALLEAAARDAEHMHLIRQLSLRSYIGVPFRVRGETVGVITFVMAESNRRYEKEDLAVALQLADRAAAAMDNARLFKESQLARAEAELANRTKDEFLAILGHELRNPLTPIVTALQLMKLRSGDEMVRERTIIERQVKHLVRLVDDLLDVARITRGKVELRKAPVAVADFVARAIEMSNPILDERQHQLTAEIPQDLFVEGDVGRLAQVVANLLNNAAKYTEKGGHVTISAERSGEDILVKVRDTGMGIAPEILANVFDAFVQEKQAIDRSRGGLGLGLAIVRSLVMQHGGSVSAQSPGIGKGATVTIRLPALAPKPRMVSNTPPAQPVLIAQVEGAPRVLLVDDNVDAAHLLCDVLEMMGYECHFAEDGQSGLRLAEKVKPVIAILDIGLPVMDGFELARRLRALPGLSKVRLVAITGYGQEADRQRSMEAGFEVHLVKPIQLEALQSALSKLAVTPVA